MEIPDLQFALWEMTLRERIAVICMCKKSVIYLISDHEVPFIYCILDVSSVTLGRLPGNEPNLISFFRYYSSNDRLCSLFCHGKVLSDIA